MRSIDGRSLDLDDVIAVARKGEPVRLAPAAAKRVDASRRALEKVVAKGTLAYGIKTGFGELANVAISDADVRALQLNLLRSHAIGQGPPLRKDEVRAALLLRANTLAMGYSGVRRILVTRLLEFLNRGVHPVIPSRGSLGGELPYFETDSPSAGVCRRRAGLGNSFHATRRGRYQRRTRNGRFAGGRVACLAAHPLAFAR